LTPKNRVNTIHDQTLSATSTDAHIVTSSLPPIQTAKVESAPDEGETKATTEQASQEEKEESDDAHKFEIEARQPLLSGNIIDSAQKDFLLTPFKFEVCLDYYLGLDMYSSPLFAKNTDVTFSSLLATTPGAGKTTPPPTDASLAAEATPSLLSQPGPQSEKMAAMASLDDPVSSQEVGVARCWRW